MWLHKLALLLLVSSSIAQEQPQREPTGVRRLRFRRPRPTPQILVDNEEGLEQGPPIPLRAQAGVPVDQLIGQRNQPNTAELLAAAFDQDRQRPAADPLQSLLATANAQPQPQEVPQEVDIPLRAAPQEEQPERRPAARRPPGVPRRRRPRPQPDGAAPEQGRAIAGEQQQQQQRAPSQRGREEAAPTVGTSERYSHMNDDGSFTFGYVSEDGSFREETRGVDCITRGKYGYIDPDGKRREFTYVSGLPCDQTGEDGEEDGSFDGDDNNRVIEDPIAPSDRFRSSQAVQLNDDEIPQSARPNRNRVRGQFRPPAGAFAGAEGEADIDLRTQEPAQANFPSFNRAQQPAQPTRRVRPRPTPTQGGSAFQNLLGIANGEEAAATLEPTPAPTQRIRPRPTTPRARPTQQANFDFDSEVDSFTLGRPAITFDDQGEQQRAQSGNPVGPNFTSELVFDPASGTFKTELRQNIEGQGEIRLQNNAAPSGRRPQPTAAPTPRPTTPSSVPFTAFASTTRRPTQPTGSPTTFQTLNFPDPASITTRPPPPPQRATPTPTPTPTPTQFIQTTAGPTRPPTRPPPQPTQPASPAPTPNSFFFQPFPTVGSPRPVAPGQPATPIPVTQPPRPATFTLGQPARPQPPQVPGFPQPGPVQIAAQPQPAAPTPTAARPPPQQQPTPQLQFGFQPVQQAQGRPFTAFANGLPPQLSGAQAQPQPFAGRPQPPPQPFQARPPPQPQFQSRPPPPGQDPRQLGIPPQLQFQQQQVQQSRFLPFGRPPPQPQAGQPSPFTVFNPSSLRGA